MFFKWADPTNRRNFAVLPYIKGITEPLTRILKEHDIQVTSRPVKTLQQHFPIRKFRPAEDDQCNVKYKISCASCPWNYIGETKRSFTTRRKEHMRKIKHCTKGSNVEKHALLTSTTLRSSTKQTTGVERHRIHGTRQKLLGRAIIRARSQENTTFSQRNTNFLGILNILFSTYFYLLIYMCNEVANAIKQCSIHF